MYKSKHGYENDNRQLWSDFSKGMFLLHGAGCIALLSLLASVYESTPLLAAEVFIVISVFAFGAFLNVLANLTLLLKNQSIEDYQKKWRPVEEKHNRAVRSFNKIVDRLNHLYEKSEKSSDEITEMEEKRQLYLEVGEGLDEYHSLLIKRGRVISARNFIFRLLMTLSVLSFPCGVLYLVLKTYPLFLGHE